MTEDLISPESHEPGHEVGESKIHLAVLYPAIAEAAFRFGASSIVLIDVARSHERDNLVVDTVSITYSTRQTLGDPDSRWKITCRLVGDRPVPRRPLPQIEAKVAVRSLESLHAAFAQVPTDSLPVVITSWALSVITPKDRQHFLHLLCTEAAERKVAWVSVEGVGVGPGVPTLGDRRASGHSIVGVAQLDRTSLRIDAVGRCWSRGRVLEWLADE